MPEGYNFPRGNCIHCVGVGTNVEEEFDLADLLNVAAKTLGNRKFGSSYKAGLIGVSDGSHKTCSGRLGAGGLRIECDYKNHDVDFRNWSDNMSEAQQMPLTESFNYCNGHMNGVISLCSSASKVVLDTVRGAGHEVRCDQGLDPQSLNIYKDIDFKWLEKKLQFKVVVRVQDGTGTASFVLFHREVRRLINDHTVADILESQHQKWSNKKQKEKVNNMVLFDKANFDKLLSKAPKFKFKLQKEAATVYKLLSVLLAFV
ncbi:40S ribosomal protein S25 [Tanacetum coccineum]